VSDSRAWPARLALHLVPDEPDQVLRLAQFRQEHPDVVIGTGEFGTWQAGFAPPVAVAIKHSCCSASPRTTPISSNSPQLILPRHGKHG
jgi:hypothetical protein